MKTLLCTAAAAALLLAAPRCAAQTGQRGGQFGAGVVLGEPTGIAWKYRINSVNAVDGAVGFSPYNSYRVHVDYLWQTFPFEERNLGIHYGAGIAFGGGDRAYTYRGGVLFRHDELGFGLRGVVGLDYLIRNSPVDLFFELAPLVVLTPTSDSGIDVGFGARVYF
jgi:hypothetical protein